MFRSKKCHITKEGILYIPNNRGPFRRLGIFLFVCILCAVFAALGLWWFSAAFGLMALWVVIYAPALEIHPDKPLFRISNNFRLFPSRWEELPPSKYLSVFGVSLGFEDKSIEYYNDENDTDSGYESISTDAGVLQNDEDKEVYIFLVTESRERFVLTHYANRNLALEHARMIAAYMKLDLWNATVRPARWEHIRPALL